MGEIAYQNKFVFIDTEFTGEHSRATLVSLGMVTLEGDNLYVTLNDFDRDQVTDWLKTNVLSKIDEAKSVSSPQAYEQVSKWLERYSEGQRVSLVSAGKGSDLLLLFELWKYSQPGLKYFHALHHLPPYLNHAGHLDLDTLFWVAGVDPNIDREEFINHSIIGERHNALYDAQVVRACFLKIRADLRLPQ